MSTALPDRDWIAAHIPHHGRMCLLDAVEAWDAEHIRCTSLSHHAPDNPLRSGDRLGALNAIEYAAQAMAVHGALLADAAPAATAPAPGFLGSARGVSCMVDRLDDIEGALTISAERLSADARTLLYAFTVSAAERPLVQGRVAVVLGHAPSPS
ncbi:hydroxymyristoyl-ACP dehydratase [Parazoarcus communis]|uniref:Hydroxymyristoyl-ACP dehydratase n=1 Tax=Parazoarcus communis TaxID=41977 RepID=A0A2U8GVQ4_9RHOO|nr:hydroxymyristoyl-ACP dehydratase [Parazoarcus communis]AWI76515.1 hydroxymyristoyl-ACP dehydratase [Parazoarcus communis]